MKPLSPGLVISLYLAGATITYGHVVNENRPLLDKCRQEASDEVDRTDCAFGFFFSDLLESALWPSHWSDVASRHR
jgi:hypothetical protein